MHDDIKTVLLTKEEIDARVQEMGKQIAADYADKDLVVIVLLKGAAWFATDLTRAIDMPLRVDFMVASSYGNGTSTSGSVKVKLDVSEDIKGKDIEIINTSKLTPLFERIIVASGDSNRQVRSLARNVEDKLREAGAEILSTEGEDGGEWILVDVGAVVVHVMQPAIRSYYNLEELWGGKGPARVRAAVTKPA